MSKIDLSFFNQGWKGNAEYLLRLQESIEQVEQLIPGTGGLLNPIGLVKHDDGRECPYEVVHGKHRTRVQLKRGKESIWAVIYGKLTERQIDALRFSENTYRRMVSGAEFKANFDVLMRNSLKK